MASFEFTELKIRRTIVRKSIVYSETRYAFTGEIGLPWPVRSQALRQHRRLPTGSPSAAHAKQNRATVRPATIRLFGSLGHRDEAVGEGRALEIHGFTKPPLATVTPHNGLLPLDHVADPTGTVFRGTLAPKCCGMRGFSIKLASEEDEALLTFDVSTCAGFCDKYEVLDSAGATAAQLFEPSCFGKLCQALLPCRGGQLILSAKDSAGEPMFDLRTPPACICACKCGCTLQCGCCSCCKDLVVMLAIT